MSQEKILVVDDVGFNRLLLKKHLTGAGYEVDQAPGGQEALKLLSRNRFDIVVTDLMMPDLDGLQLLAEAKKESFFDELGAIPCPAFILCTANVGAGTIEEATQKGFADVLTKPVEPQRLLESVKKALSGTQDTLAVNLVGNDATIAKTLADMTGEKPERVLATLLEVVSLCEFGGGVNSLEALRSYLRDKLDVDLSAPIEAEEADE